MGSEMCIRDSRQVIIKKSKNRIRSLTFAKQVRHMGWWDNQHGNQLRISGTATFAFALLTTMSAAQLMFLQDNADFADYTGLAIVLIVIGAIGLAVSAPAFINLNARASTLERIKTIKSTSELRKMKPDGDEAARILGGGHEEAWNAFLQEKGLKKR